MIGTPPRISTEPTRATPPLVRGAQSLAIIYLKRQPRRGSTMIKGVIIVNNLGVVRLAKFYEQVHVTGESAEQAQQSVIKKSTERSASARTTSATTWRGRFPSGAATRNLYIDTTLLYTSFSRARTAKAT